MMNLFSNMFTMLIYSPGDSTKQEKTSILQAFGAFLNILSGWNFYMLTMCFDRYKNPEAFL